MTGTAPSEAEGPAYLRGRAAALVESAVRQGFPGAHALWDMSPREAALALEGFAAARRAEAARDERLAWMAGYYCAVAFHAPKRYPARSGETFRTPGAPMTEAQMKAVLLAFAAERSMRDDIGNLED